MNSIIFLFTLLLLLVIITAMMAAAETAFFSLKPIDKDFLKRNDDKASIIAKKLIDTPKQLLSIILIVINFSNIAIVLTVSSILKEYISEEHDKTLFFVLDVIVSTFVILLIGEVIPKIYASKNNVKTVLVLARPLNFLNSLPPISWLRAGLVSGSEVISKYAKKKGVQISSDELEQALALTKEENVSEGEHKILEGIVKFGNTDVTQIMCSRMHVSAMQDDLNFKQVLAFILECGYSRIPVFSESFDDIKGILFIKDLLPFLDQDETFNWKELTRKPIFVPENKKIDDLLKEFQSKKVHMAIVVDEYGGASGVVTLEDVLEEIVGDITDEFDDAEILHKKVDENTFLIEGKIALNDFYKILDIDGKDFDAIKGESDSLGGFIIENAGRILKNKEYFICSNVKLIVESSDKKRIKMIKVVVLNTSSES